MAGDYCTIALPATDGHYNVPIVYYIYFRIYTLKL